GQVQMNGSGGGTGGGNFGAQFSAGFVLGSSATSVTFNANGSGNGVAALNTNLAGVVSSNTFAGAPLIVNTAGLANTGNLIVSAANTFAGGIQLKSGNLILNNTNAVGIFGNNINTLTINSTASGNATLAGTGTLTFTPIVTSAGGGDL